jgi:8-oxo-dGTP pyrophosphatase MutT (NUDIX family)
MFCNNCGDRGHVFKVCTDPVTSCGLILLNQPNLPVDPDKVQILMVRRKHSMAYTEFIRGKYDSEDTEYVKKLLSNMTVGEQMMMTSVEFSELWTSHWGVGRDYHSQEYEVSIKKFKSINLPSLIAEVGSAFAEPEWGFPKGRRLHRESDIDCATREFSEETNILRNSYVVCRNLILHEQFTGTNGIEYKHTYYIALLREPKLINLLQNMTDEQQREVSAISWKSIANCKTLTRPHYTQRSEMLDSLKKVINTFNLQDNIASS